MAAKHKNRNTPAPAAPQAPQAPAAAPAAAPAPVAATPVNTALAVVYTTGKPYNVRPGTAQSNARSWGALQEVLQAGNGQATMGQLQQAVAPYNHVPFVQYCIRRGWLTAYVAPQASAPAQASAPSTHAA